MRSPLEGDRFELENRWGPDAVRDVNFVPGVQRSVAVVEFGSEVVMKSAVSLHRPTMLNQVVITDKKTSALIHRGTNCTT